MVGYAVHLGGDAEGWTPRFPWWGEGNAPVVPGLPARIHAVGYVPSEDSGKVWEGTKFDFTVTEAEYLRSDGGFEEKVRELTKDMEPVAPGISPDRLRKLGNAHSKGAGDASGPDSASAGPGWLGRNRGFALLSGGLGILAAIAGWITLRAANRPVPARRRASP